MQNEGQGAYSSTQTAPHPATEPLCMYHSAECSNSLSLLKCLGANECAEVTEFLLRSQNTQPHHLCIKYTEALREQQLSM